MTNGFFVRDLEFFPVIFRFVGLISITPQVFSENFSFSVFVDFPIAS